MRNILSKEFCIWLVSPSDGTVRKIRLTSAKILISSIFLFVLCIGFVFVAGDYTRVQVLRAKHYFHFKRLSSERGNLVSHNRDLRSQVNNLEQEKKRVLLFENQVRERLDKLSEVLGAVGEFGIRSDFAKGADSSAIGGAEVDCAENKDGCSQEGQVAYQPSSWRPLGGEHDLLGELERSIALARVLPLARPVLGTVNSAFGLRRSPFSGKIKQHQGVDFALPYGSKVFATGDGVVKSVSRTGTYGLKIDIQHMDKVLTRYAHLSEVFVKKGQKIQRGAVIGAVGSSGRSTGPHLHYEIRVANRAINPARLFEISEAVGQFI